MAVMIKTKPGTSRVTTPVSTKALTKIGTATNEIQTALNSLLADIFALYFKTKGFHWHVHGPSFRDYHLLFDEQASSLIDATDIIAERVRKIGAETLSSINQASEMTHIKPSLDMEVPASKMVQELLSDNEVLAKTFKSAHKTCSKYYDVASTSVLETLLDETERRVWFLREILNARK